MIRLILGLSFLFLVLAVLVGLPVAYVLWMVKTWRRGRKGLFWSQTAVAVLVTGALGFMMDLTPASHWYWERKRTLALTGFAFSFERTVYHYDTGPSFNGDGYVMTVAALRPETARYFSAPPPGFFTDYPKESECRYELKPWHTGPVSAEEEFFIQFAFAANPPQKEEARLKKTFEAIRRSLAKPTAHYAYSYLMNGKSVSDIVFFLIDPEERRFYLISNHT